MKDITDEMSETQHTPGPWSLHESDLREIIAADGGPVAFAAVSRMSMADVESNSGEASANARLIAAAPSLLSAALIALEQIQRTFQTVQLTPSLDDGLCTAKDELRDAINKALAH